MHDWRELDFFRSRGGLSTTDSLESEIASDLLAFEERWRQAEIEREKRREADHNEQEVIKEFTMRLCMTF
jgi:hypothetical protein